MGIQGLNQLLREIVPEAFRHVNISLFEGRRIAVDAPLLLFAKFSSAFSTFASTRMKIEDLLAETLSDDARNEVRRLVADRVTAFVKEMYSSGITPIFVFDGTAAPEKTSGARLRRKDRRDATESRIRTLRDSINSADPLFRSASDTAALRSLIAQIPPIKPAEDIKWFRHVIGSFGAPIIDAPDEAEKMCAALTASGIAAGSWTTDTDSYAFGATLVLTGYDETTRPPPVITADGFVARRPTPTHFTAVVPPLILKKTGLTRAQFTDLCIMLGCDFNSRVKGIGPAKSWKLFQTAREKYPDSTRLIELIAADNEIDFSLLNAERCREIFLSADAIDAVISEARKMDLSVNIKAIESTEVLEAAVLGGIGSVKPRDVKIR
jgi:flap endonuclease-1